MKVTTIPARELSPDLVGRWAAILRAEPALDSPYFRPEFVQAVAACRTDVEIGLIEQSGARQLAEQAAAERAREAMRSLEPLDLQADRREELQTLASYVVQRTR